MSDHGTPTNPNNPYGNTPGGPSGPGVTDSKGFIGALFDFSFSHFITPMIVKAVYILAVVALGLAWIFFLIAAFSQSVGGGLFVLVLGPIGIVIYLAFIRMTLEFYLAIVRMSQDIHLRSSI